MGTLYNYESKPIIKTIEEKDLTHENILKHLSTPRDTTYNVITIELDNDELLIIPNKYGGSGYAEKRDYKIELLKQLLKIKESTEVISNSPNSEWLKHANSPFPWLVISKYNYK